MDAMKDALMKRKNKMQHEIKISIELDPASGKEEEMDKKMGLAPSVKDAKSPKEKKLMADSSEVELPGQDNSLEEEASESPSDMEKEAMMAMPEMPNGREPNSLHEKVKAAMEKEKMTKKLKK